jgi:hypothetical protein
MIFVNLHKGNIELAIDVGPTSVHGHYTFDEGEHERMGDILAQIPGFKNLFMCSSSCNHPAEYGFDDDFDVDVVLRKAIEYAGAKTAFFFEMGPLETVPERLDRVLKEVSFPITLNLVASGKKGEDVYLPFDEEKDLDYFAAGVRYARRLVACNGGQPCTNESASATPTGARPARKTSSTAASRQTISAKASRSTAGSAKRAARSARTPKGSSRANRRSGGG